MCVWNANSFVAQGVRRVGSSINKSWCQRLSSTTSSACFVSLRTSYGFALCCACSLLFLQFLHQCCKCLSFCCEWQVIHGNCGFQIALYMPDTTRHVLKQLTMLNMISTKFLYRTKFYMNEVNDPKGCSVLTTAS